MKTAAILGALLSLLIVQALSGATIYVPAQFSSIQDAITMANQGDTIWVAPGTYVENVTFGGKSVKVLSVDGPDVTFWKNATAGGVTVNFAGGVDSLAEVRGFTFQQGSDRPSIVINIDYSAPTIDGNFFPHIVTSNWDPVIRINTAADVGTSQVLIKRNLFYSNSAIGCVGIYLGNPQIINNTFDSNDRGFFTLDKGVAENNIVTRSKDYGVFGAFSRLDYNDVWLNNPDYSYVNRGFHDISADPLYEEPNNGDYYLLAGSPCIDAGDPDPRFNDPGGSLNDMGALTNDLGQSLPRISIISLDSTYISKTSRVFPPVFYWQYVTHPNTGQEQLEVEVSYTSSFTDALLLSSGAVTSSLAKFTYYGPSLQERKYYFVRIRIYDGIAWSAWRVATFEVVTRRVIIVPLHAASIQAGIDMSEPGDTVLVSPGIYHESLNFEGKAVRVLSEKGPDSTTIQFSGNYGNIGIQFTNGEPSFAQLGGFRLTNYFVLMSSVISIANGASPTIKNNVFDNSQLLGPLIDNASDTSVISGNLFYHNRTLCINIRAGQCNVFNNTFDQNGAVLSSTSDHAYVENNVISNSGGYGVDGAFGLLDYNDVWNNHTNYSNCTPGPHSISLDPLYVDTAGHNYHLRPNSPCVDAGDPNPTFNDPDSSRNDMGAFNMPLKLPLALNLRPLNEVANHVVNPLPTFAWDFYSQPQGQVQTQFQVQLGIDSTWLLPPLWESGQVTSSTTQTLYAGSPLVVGFDYFVRCRVRANGDWGSWTDLNIRMNRPPSTPFPLYPLNGFSVSVGSPQLIMANAADTDGDTLTYDFQVYGDAALSQLVAAKSNVKGFTDATLSGTVSSLAPGTTYWWRGRAFDHYAYSSWTDAASFSTRIVGTIKVTQELSRIQWAVECASSGDTIAVGAGSFREDIDLKGKKLVLQGLGNSQTVLRSFTQYGYILNLSSNEPVGTVIKGFQFSGTPGAAIYVGGGSSPLITENTFTDTSAFAAEIILDNSSTTITRNVFRSNPAAGCIDSRFGSVLIANNVFDGALFAVLSTNEIASCLNNIAINCSLAAFEGSMTTSDYNVFWSNKADFLEGALRGSHDRDLDPKLINETAGDYHLRPGSPCYNAGSPAPQYNDPDGSRNDIGAYYHSNTPPSTFLLTKPDNDLIHPITSILPLFTWQQPTDPDQYDLLKYELVIALDSTFSFTRIVDDILVDSVVVTESLSWGNRYWWKVKATDLDGASTWSSSVFTFRTNSAGDADGNGKVNLSDVVFLVYYVFAGGSAPNPLNQGDANCDGKINLSDAVYLISYIFDDGAAPCFTP